MKKIISKISVVFAVSICLLSAQVPSASMVSEHVKSLWMNNELILLEDYVVDLISENPDYVPALLAASFHDSVFKGKLVDAKSKLEAIKSDANLNEGKYSEEFIGALYGIIKILENEISMHRRHGISDEELESNASASTVRSVWGATLLPQIRILEIADDISI